MAQSSFSTQAPFGTRKTFQAGDHIHTQVRKPSVMFITPPHTDLVSNTPYAGKFGSAQQNMNPFGYLKGVSGKRMEMQKTPLPRNNGYNTSKKYGSYGY